MTVTVQPARQEFSLTPPSALTGELAQEKAGAVPLADEQRVALNAKIDVFVDALLTANVTSPAFQAKLDHSFSLGRQEIAEAANLSSTFTRQSFVGETDSAAFVAIAQMSELFEDLNPSKQGNLFSARKILGIPVPFGNKLHSYLRRYQSAESHMATIHENILAERTTVELSVSALGEQQSKLWTALEKLEGAAYFISELDARLTLAIEGLRVTDPSRAEALESEVLYYVRQNVSDVQAMQAVSMNGYKHLGGLRKTGRETINGCDRIATLGIAALNIGVLMAKATGTQVRTMTKLQAAKGTIESLVLATGQAMVDHAQATVAFANDPVMGIQALQQMFDQTQTAMTVLEDFRKQSLATNAANNALLSTQLAGYMEKAREQQRSASTLLPDARPIPAISNT